MGRQDTMKDHAFGNWQVISAAECGGNLAGTNRNERTGSPHAAMHG
ncbi:MAG: hypothetical protein IJ992_00510 [Lentisphaeria bacterium]|nr:hypothetical protein [Lentisphaeria bacterium]